MEWAVQKAHEPAVQRTQDEFIALIPLEEKQTHLQGPFRLQCRKTIHNIPTIALKIDAAGRTLGYSADTAYDASLIDWLAPADLIVHEACGGFMHTPYEDLLALPAELRGKMLIVHYPDNFNVAASAIEPLHQGRIYVV